MRVVLPITRVKCSLSPGRLNSSDNVQEFIALTSQTVLEKKKKKSYLKTELFQYKNPNQVLEIKFSENVVPPVP